MVEAREYARYEVPSGPPPDVLFHGTSCPNAASIIRDRLIRSQSYSFGVGVSTAEDPGSALQFAHMVDEMDWTSHSIESDNDAEIELSADIGLRSHFRDEEEGVVFALNTKNLAKLHPIRAVCDTKYWHEETEWFVSTETGIRLGRGVFLGVYVDPELIEKWAQAVPRQAAALRAILKHRLGGYKAMWQPVSQRRGRKTAPPAATPSLSRSAVRAK